MLLTQNYLSALGFWPGELFEIIAICSIFVTIYILSS